ncbi:hypothetical protein QE152_g15474 [Popillia japonica]|uniref:Uncharacterized protein n=1 Tax=Popillia japonica TaxID=7064 RepID=A0AAW1L720_POPJA
MPNDMEEVPSLTVDYGSLTVRIEAIISNAGLNVFPERKRKELWIHILYQEILDQLTENAGQLTSDLIKLMYIRGRAGNGLLFHELLDMISEDDEIPILHAEPYCGASTHLPTTGLGQGGDVVLGLADYIDAKAGTIFYFDNLFTSVGLLQKLGNLAIT